jgi:hypothetical protein
MRTFSYFHPNTKTAQSGIFTNINIKTRNDIEIA